MFLNKSSKIISKRFIPFVFISNRYYFMQPPRYDSNKDYYKILGVTKQSSEAQLKREYYKLAKQYHPDHNKGTESNFKEISQAYQVLSDKNLKAEYDQSRVFGSFTQKFARKAKEGDYQYNFYKQAYHQFTQYQQQLIRQRMNKVFKRLFLFGLGILFFSLFLQRSPNRFYQQEGGRLISIDPNTAAALNYGNQRYPHGGGGYPQGGVPYGGGKPFNPYPSNQGYTQVATNQPTANPYTPPSSNYYYNPPQRSPSFQRNQVDKTYNYNQRVQNNQANRSGSPPADL